MFVSEKPATPTPHVFELLHPGEEVGQGMLVVGVNADRQFRKDADEEVGEPGPKLVDVVIVKVPTEDGEVRHEAHIPATEVQPPQSEQN